MNIRKLRARLFNLIDDGIDVQPWLLFSLAMTSVVALASLVLVQTISEGLHVAEARILTEGSIELFGNVYVSPLLPQSLLSLLLLNLPLASVELAAITQIIIATVAMALLFELVRAYFSPRYGLLAVLVVSSGAVFLSTTTIIGSVWLSFIVLVSTILSLLRLRRGHWLGYIALPLFAAALISFGTLGSALAVVATAAVGYNIYKNRLKRPDLWTTLGMVASFLVVIGGGWLLIVSIGWSQFLSEFNVPSLDVFIENLELYLFGGANSFGWPTNWPIWNIPYTGMTLLGLGVAIKRRQAQRYQLVLLLSGLFVAGLTLPLGDINIALGVLVSGLLITSAFRYLVQSWEEVLPRNRIRHVISGVLVTALLIVTANGALTRQFIVRPSVDVNSEQLSPQSSRQLYKQFRQTADDTL